MKISGAIQKMVGLFICLFTLSGCTLLDTLGSLAETPATPSPGKPTVPIDISIKVDTQAIEKGKSFPASLSFTTPRAIESAQGKLEVFGVVSVSTSDEFTWETITANTKKAAQLFYWLMRLAKQKFAGQCRLARQMARQDIAKARGYTYSLRPRARSHVLMVRCNCGLII